MQLRLNLLACSVLVGLVALAAQDWLAVTAIILAVTILAPRVHEDWAVWKAFETAWDNVCHGSEDRVVLAELAAARQERRGRMQAGRRPEA